MPGPPYSQPNPGRFNRKISTTPSSTPGKKKSSQAKRSPVHRTATKPRAETSVAVAAEYQNEFQIACFPARTASEISVHVRVSKIKCPSGNKTDNPTNNPATAVTVPSSAWPSRSCNTSHGTPELSHGQAISLPRSNNSNPSGSAARTQPYCHANAKL